MSDEVNKPDAELERDIYAERDVWQIRDSYNTFVNPGCTTDDLKTALANNRAQFESMREEYARAVHSDGGIGSRASRKRRVYFKELNRLYSATEALKDALRQRGESFHIDEADEEHPNAAYKRYAREWELQEQERQREAERQRRAQSQCYVVTAVYGLRSKELARVRKVCRWRFAFNLLMAPSWILYKIIGGTMVGVARKNARALSILRVLIATNCKCLQHPFIYGISLDTLPWYFRLDSYRLDSPLRNYVAVLSQLLSR